MGLATIQAPGAVVGPLPGRPSLALSVSAVLLLGFTVRQRPRPGVRALFGGGARRLRTPTGRPR